jgi:KipI family sensor histidine kinase inhibitor
VPDAIDRLRGVVEAADDGTAGDGTAGGGTASDGTAGGGRGPLVEVPTRYGGVDGPDLDEVAAMHGLPAAAVIEAHASVEYRAYFLGFAPGFAYLGRVPAAIATPRLPTPRTRVPAGSVGLAGEQTAVYPSDSPGGWRLIGRTDLRVWDPAADAPARIPPGARVRFVPVR